MQSQISKSVIFPHPIGIVLGAVSIGDNCMILQNVTMGESSKKGLPTIGNNTSVYAGAVVGGGIVIGENCSVGANSVITKDIEPNSVVVGANKIIRKNKAR
ncbi:TPA: hypothetical protein VGT17_005236 [Vibrio harveyi]|nr:hypothetical protein [Vibrio harveyi]HEQ3599234.1 hypothetical protein [Vibrio harveyi]HEQ3611326.1 hypothetical protein [Vibrio harveyi]